jgi:hypothetical protein
MTNITQITEFWKHQRKRLFNFVTLLCIGVVSAIVMSLLSLDQPTIAQTNSIPEVLNDCIPSAQVARSELVGQTQLQGREYYLLAAYEQGDEIGSDLVISTADGTCEQLLYNPMGDRISLTTVVPQAVAQQLTLARYRREIQRSSEETFQQQINQAAASTQNPIWFAEEVWALQQLGITVPDNVQTE